MKKRNMSTIILVLATIATGLIAGLFYAYSVSVNGALGRLDDATYLKTMQSINLVILNPLFFASFIGTLLLLPAAAYCWYDGAMRARFLLLLAATVVYGVGTFGVTVFGNVPLNEALAAFPLDGAANEAMHTAREKFEKPWNAYHTARTWASVAALALVVLACVKPD